MTFGFVTLKLLRGILTLFLAVTFVFLILRFAGDPMRLMLPDDTPPDVLEHYRHVYGLDLPPPVQYLRYLQGLTQGEFGYSFRDQQPALDTVMSRVPATLLLGLVSFALSTIFGMVAGVIAALKRGSTVDHAVISFSIFGHSMPSFFLGILMILLFAMTWRILPSAGMGTPAHLVMPALTLAVGGAGAIARFTRSSMLEVLSQPYIRTARAKGVPVRTRVLRDAVPNAAIPVITVLGLRMGGLISGTVVVETVFAWPGIGQLLVTAVGQRDLAVVQTIVILIAFTMVTANYLVDLAYRWLDPRIATAGKDAG
ncbi:MAG: ABC transporter permease [Nitratireductor sp.]|uniref:ABC transporter permease n=1 Tax=Nitratireductor sp. TaxID=1872084 RepID=UPI002609A911|nr:ABC transporter permease [Nitratireductor sp.]MCV0349697.1 ABC transporter permease [Nitratireductor sp.]